MNGRMTSYWLHVTSHFTTTTTTPDHLPFESRHTTVPEQSMIEVVAEYLCTGCAFLSAKGEKKVDRGLVMVRFIGCQHYIRQLVPFVLGNTRERRPPTFSEHFQIRNYLIGFDKSLFEIVIKSQIFFQVSCIRFIYLCQILSSVMDNLMDSI